MKRLWFVALALLVVATLLDVVLGKDLPGLTSALGLFGCIAIIVGSKWLGRFLQRREAYYIAAEEATPADPGASQAGDGRG